MVTKILTDVDIIISTGANSKQTTGQILNKRYPIKDKLSFDITPYLDEVFDLIHCKSGINRSPAFTIAYLVKYNDMTLDEAKEHVSSVRKINHKKNFMEQIEKHFSQSQFLFLFSL